MTIDKLLSLNKNLPFIGVAICFVLVSFIQQSQGLTCSTCLFDGQTSASGSPGFSIHCRDPNADTPKETCANATVKYCEKRYLKFVFEGNETIEILSRQCSAETGDMQGNTLPVCMDLPPMTNQDVKTNMGPTTAQTNIQTYLIDEKKKNFDSVTQTGKVCLCNADIENGCNKGPQPTITDQDGTLIVMTTAAPPPPPTPEGGNGDGGREDGGHDAAGGLLPPSFYSLLSAPAFFLGSYLMRSGTSPY